MGPPVPLQSMGQPRPQMPVGQPGMYDTAMRPTEFFQHPLPMEGQYQQEAMMPEGTVAPTDMEEEELLFDMHHMQAPEAPHVEMTIGQVPPEPSHMASSGPPPPPEGYNPLGAGYMAPGPSYLTAAQEIPFAPVYPGYPSGGQVSAQRMNPQGLKPPK